MSAECVIGLLLFVDFSVFLGFGALGSFAVISFGFNCHSVMCAFSSSWYITVLFVKFPLLVAVLTVESIIAVFSLSGSGCLVLAFHIPILTIMCFLA